MTEVLDRPSAPPATRLAGVRQRMLNAPRDRARRMLEPSAGPHVEAWALASAVLGLLSLVPVAPWLRAVLLAVFILTGPGLATVLWIRLNTTAAVVALVPTTGMAVMAASTATMIWTGWWRPIPLLLVCVAAVIGSATLHAARHRRLAPAWPAAAHPDRWRVTAPYLCIVAALSVWAVALPGMAVATDAPLGLLFTGTGPILVPVAAALVAVFVVAVRNESLVTAMAAIGALIMVFRLTATLVTDLPIYPWTYKHLGIVDYLLQNRALPPTGIDVYREWPAFFTSFAWFCDITSLDPTMLAHWFAPVIHVLLALVVGGLAVTLGLDRRETLTAVLIAEMVNWVAQDYFAPQAFGFVLGLGVIVAMLCSRTSPAAGWLGFGLFAALVPAHQLTPFWVFGVVVALALMRRIRPLWIVIPFAVVLIGYLRPRRYIVFQHGGLSSLNPFANGAGNVDYVGSAEKMFTSLVCRGLSATVVLLAVFGVVVWWRTRRPFGVPVVLAFSSFVLLVLNSYGGEAIFRVYLYALPGCAVLIAPMVVAAITARGPRYRVIGPAVAFVGVAVTAAAGLQAYYGNWQLNVQKPSQLALLENLATSVDGSATFWNLHTAGFPGRSTAQSVMLAEDDDDFDSPIFSRWPGFERGFPDAGQFDDITSLAWASKGESFFVFSDEARSALGYYGHPEAEAIDRFKAMFEASPAWCIRLQDETTTVYRFQAPIPSLTGGPPKVCS